MKSILPLLLLIYFPIVLSAQENTFSTCYINLCEDGDLTIKQVMSADVIEVKSTIDGESYGLISFTAAFLLNGNKIECTCRENKFTTRCLSLRDKLLVGDQMILEDVVFKDIKGGGKIRTAPKLTITIVKPYDEE